MYKSALARVGLLGLLLILLAGIANYASANSSTIWINDSLTIQNEGELQSAANIPPSINGNRDCMNHKFVTRPKSAAQSEISHSACAIQTLYGRVDSSGWLEFNGTGTAGKLINYPGYSIGSVPVPNSKILINYTSTGVGAQLYFNQNLPLAIVANTAISGEVTYKINSPAQISLRDKSNSLLLTQLDTISFSGNGRWMVVDAKNRAILRVNLETFEVLPFAPSFNYSIGVDPGVKSAITSDGRYGVVYSKNFSTFKIYDLETCGPVPNSINTPVSCQSKDLMPATQSQIEGLRTIDRIRFIDNKNIVFYASYQPPGQSVKIAKFRLTSGVSSQSGIELLALGDSYISGEGAFEYKSGTDTPDNKCHLSLISHPYLASATAGLNSYQSVACSGARIPHLTDREIPKDGFTEPQAKGKDDPIFTDSILNDFLPGYRAQLSFVEKHSPDKVLVSIGGNDIGFSEILKRCLSFDTCYSFYEERLELVRAINAKFPELVDTYTKIKQESTPSSKIYAIGYPQIADPSGNCAANVHLNAQELEFSKEIINYLNTVIELAASKAGVAYIDTQKALNGHRLCETKSSEVAVHGVTAGSDRPSFLNGPLGNESFHPNKLGHELLSATVLANTDNFTKTMPMASLNSTPPAENGLPFLDAPKSGLAIGNIRFDADISPDMIYRDFLWDVSINSVKHYLRPSSVFNFVLKSEPVELGAATSSPTGGLSANLRIPGSVPAGFHTLHIYGKNIAGESVDIYKTIYVAKDEIDYDDDGLANEVDSCPTFENSGVDYDKDGVDDACDGYIGEPPALPYVPPTAPNLPPMENPGSDTSEILGNGTTSNNAVVSPQSAQTLSETAEPVPVAQPSTSSFIASVGTGTTAQDTVQNQDMFVLGTTSQPPASSATGNYASNSLQLPQAGNKAAMVGIFTILAIGLVGFRRLLSDVIV